MVLHIVTAGAWIGIDVVVAVLVLTGWFADDMSVRSLAYRALAEFVVWPMLGSGLVCLATGVVLGAGTKWGLVRYWWVVVKLVLNLLLCTLILVLLAPGMDAVASYGEDLLTGTPSTSRVETLFFPPAVSLTTLTIATVLAVYKPWGRLRNPLAMHPKMSDPNVTGAARSRHRGDGSGGRLHAWMFDNPDGHRAETALDRARTAAGDGDVSILGGAETITRPSPQAVRLRAATHVRRRGAGG